MVIVVYISDLISDSHQADIAKHLQNRAVTILEQLTQHQLNRMLRILLLLPVLNTPSVEELDRMLFRPVIGQEIPMETIIFTI